MEALERGLRVMDPTALDALHGERAADPRLQHGRRAQHRPDSVRRARGDAGDDMSELDRRDCCADAARAHGQVGRGDAARVRLRAHRPRQPGAAGPHRASTTTARRRRCKQLATINAPEARLLTVQPYDKSSIKAIEKAISESDIGLNPSNDGNMIRLAIPELTEERRKELVKVVAAHRRGGARSRSATSAATCMHDLRELKDEGEAGADDEHRAEDGAAEAHRRAASPSSTRSSRPRKKRSSRSEGLPSARVGAAARYVAIITDGNGRWAQAARRCRSPRATGRAPTPSRRACATPSTSGSRELTVYSFSTENWSRPPDEVDALMAMFCERIDRETPELHEEGVRMRFIGRREGVLPELVRADGVGRGR